MLLSLKLTQHYQAILFPNNTFYYLHLKCHEQIENALFFFLGILFFVFSFSNSYPLVLYYE